MQRYPDPKDRFVRDLKLVEIKEYEATKDREDWWYDPDILFDRGELRNDLTPKIEAHPITISLEEKWPAHKELHSS